MQPTCTDCKGEQADCAVKSLTCESEPLTQEKVSIELVSTAFSRNRVEACFNVMKAIINKKRRCVQAIHFYADSVNATVRQYIYSSASNADVHDGR